MRGGWARGGGGWQRAPAATRLLSALLSPPPIDYATASRRGTEPLVELSDNVTRVSLVPKSKFAEFRDKSISAATLRVLSAMGTPLDKFPGTKLLVLPDAEARHVAFFDDSAILSKLSLDPILGALKSSANRTYAFYGADEKEELDAPLATALASQHAIRSHRFSFLRSRPSADTSPPASIVWPSQADRKAVLALSRATTLYKDLVDSPALTLGPAQLSQAAAAIAAEYGAEIDVMTGVQELIARGYPQVAAVGMASAEDRAPRVVDFRWAPPGQTLHQTQIPLVTIVGKGVCFDSGGLNIKGGGGMRQMKKDMAGAAQALALALLIMEHGLAVRLRVLLPCVENSISGGALRPGDVIRARNNLTTEIHNTDAEGRLILADCLVAACEEGDGGLPALVVDFATLTGAARVALGTELPALFCNNHTELLRLFELSQSDEVNDPVWPLPLWQPYKTALKSSVADLVNAAEGAGAITAALYLAEFVAPLSAAAASAKDKGEDEGEGGDAPAATHPTRGVWMHLDFMGTKQGAAEPQGMRAVFEYIKRVIAPVTNN